MNFLRRSALCGTVILLLLSSSANRLHSQETTGGKAAISDTAPGKDAKSSTDSAPVTPASASASPATATATQPATDSTASSSDGPAPVIGDVGDPQAPAAPATVTPTTGPPPGFFTRWGKAYVADWSGNAPGTDPSLVSKRRGTPPPIFSPPYPSTDWPIGGTILIGAPDTQTYPLMQAVNENKTREKWYGWVSVGANGSTNNRSNASKGIPANFPSAYDEFSNTIVLDQFAVYYERIPNEAQKDHFDWGWRVTSLYGQDYRFTTTKGFLSQQLLVKNAQYGWDLVMFYLDFYLPKIGQGTNVRFGRYISLPDIEAQLAPNNYTYSHSILYTFDCYTQLGMNVTTKISDHWTVQGGISPGCDVMPWTTDARVTGNVCLQYTWSNGGDDLYTCDNTINNGKYAYNNLTAFYETWYHRINASWHTDTEGWYQYMRETPNMYWYNGTDPNTGIQYANTPQTPWPQAQNYRPGTGAVNLNYGAICVDPRLPAAQQPSRCYAPEWAITNYVEHNFWKNQASLNIRNEFFDDIKGQRTGTPGKYEEHMVGFDFWAGSTVTFRPEISFTKYYGPWGLRALNISPGSAIPNLQNGNPQQGKTYAATLAADLIWHF